jgi:hypothetical protein
MSPSSNLILDCLKTKNIGGILVCGGKNGMEGIIFLA